MTRTTVSLIAAIWKVCARGGWWTTAEIREELPLHMQTVDISPYVHSAARRHNTLEVRTRKGRLEYAVTMHTRPPITLSLREVLEALNIGVTNEDEKGKSEPSQYRPTASAQDATCRQIKLV
jgi:hypothetical protein